MTLEEVLPFYVLDAVTDKERAWVEAYLLAFPEEVAILFELQAQVLILNQSVASIEPRSEIKRDLMARIAAHLGVQAFDQQTDTGLNDKTGSR